VIIAYLLSEIFRKWIIFGDKNFSAVSAKIEMWLDDEIFLGYVEICLKVMSH
jgi:hypothetical protein